MLAAYPYRFQAVLYHDEIVTLTRPYDSQVPVTAFLAAMDPTLAGKPADDPDVRAAQDQQVLHEMRATELMLAQPDVKSVVWHLDSAWLDRHGIAVSD